MLTFVYGGSGSGKSEYAERLLLKAGASTRVYIATMRPDGGEAEERIARHRLNRAGKGFIGIERYTALARLGLPDNAAALLECVGNLLANEMFSPEGAGAPEAANAVWEGVETLRRRVRDLVVVSNDVVSDGVDYPPETARYCTALAEVNRRVAAAAETVVEMVCGIPLYRKKEESCAC